MPIYLLSEYKGTFRILLNESCKTIRYMGIYLCIHFSNIRRALIDNVWGVILIGV